VDTPFSIFLAALPCTQTEFDYLYGTVVVSPNGTASAVTGDTFNSTCDTYYYVPTVGMPDYTITSESGIVICNTTGHWVNRNPCEGKNYRIIFSRSFCLHNGNKLAGFVFLCVYFWHCLSKYYPCKFLHVCAHLSAIKCNESEISSIENGTMSVTDPNNAFTGTTFNLTCDMYFTGSMNGALECLANGQINNKPSCTGWYGIRTHLSSTMTCTLCAVQKTITTVMQFKIVHFN